MSHNVNFKSFIFPGAFAIILMLSGCNKKNQHHVSGRYIDMATQKGIGGEEFQIVETVDRGWFKSSRRVIKLTKTDENGYFDFGTLILRKRSENQFSVSSASPGEFTDYFKLVAVAPIEFKETENYYNFYVVPAFKNLYVNLGRKSNLTDGDSLSYRMESEYLKQSNDHMEYPIEAFAGITSLPFTVHHHRGPIGRYFVTIRRKLNNVVSVSRDTIILGKGDFTYQIDL